MSTTGLVLGALAFIAFVLVLLKMKPNAISKAVSETLKDHDIKHVLDVIDESASVSKQATDFNTAIKPIWDAYERELACGLIKNMVKRCSNEPIAQHWLLQVAQVEPDLARKQFSEAFLKEYYKPDIAAGCMGGSCSSGNCAT